MSENVEINNAIIKSYSIDIERDFIVIWLNLDYGGTGQGFGGYCLYNPRNPMQDLTGLFLLNCMKIAGVDEINKIIDKPIRVKSNSSRVIEIGHFLKDIWFNPELEFINYAKDSINE